MSARSAADVFADAATVIRSGGGKSPRVIITFPDLDAAHRAAPLLIGYMGRQKADAAPAHRAAAPSPDARITVEVWPDRTSCRFELAKGLTFAAATELVLKARDVITAEVDARMECPAAKRPGEQYGFMIGHVDGTATCKTGDSCPHVAKCTIEQRCRRASYGENAAVPSAAGPADAVASGLVRPVATERAPAADTGGGHGG